MVWQLGPPAACWGGWSACIQSECGLFSDLRKPRFFLLLAATAHSSCRMLSGSCAAIHALMFILAVSHLVISMFSSVPQSFQALHRLATSMAQGAQGSLGSQEERTISSLSLSRRFRDDWSLCFGGELSCLPMEMLKTSNQNKWKVKPIRISQNGAN